MEKRSDHFCTVFVCSILGIMLTCNIQMAGAVFPNRISLIGPKKKTNQQLIQRYFELVKVCDAIDYTSKKSVRKNNKAADAMGKIVSQLWSNEEGRQLFESLLDCPQKSVKYWAAFQLIYLKGISAETEMKCLSLIKTEADKGNFAYQLWLKGYEKDKNKKIQDEVH